MKTCDLVIIGGGPAGLAAALGARKQGIKDILIVERDKELGGILNQCIHNGFGLHTFKEELTGPEYAGRYIEQVKDAGIPYVVDSMVLSIQSMSQYKSSLQADQCEYNKEKYSEADQDKYSKKKYTDKIITMVSRTEGIVQIQAKAVILAMGCRERPRGALNIPGYRPAGIYSAGTAQRLVNMEGYLPGREVVILGSGDIGLIMARRMTLEGAHVKVVAELMPYSGGLKRNIVQCLNDYDIPLKLSHTVVDIHGKERVTGITLAKVDEKGKPIPGTEEEYACDTLLLSCGLIPENELSRELGVKLNPVTSGPVVDESLETNVPGVFACGNVLHVHDLVDFVSEEADRAGTCAARYILQENQSSNPGIDQESQYSDSDIGKASKMNDNNDPVIPLISTGCVRYTVPSAIHLSKMPDKLKVRFRVGKVVKNCAVDVYCNEENSENRIKTKKRPVVAPGEMEEILLGREELLKYPDLQQLIITVKEGETMEEKKLICIGCPLGCELCAVLERGEVISVTGNTCKRGDAYARKELVSPERTVTSTVKMSDGRMLPVRTKTDIPKAKVLECVRELKHVVVEAPVETGQIIVQDIAGTNVPVIATKKMGERI